MILLFMRKKIQFYVIFATLFLLARSSLEFILKACMKVKTKTTASGTIKMVGLEQSYTFSLPPLQICSLMQLGLYFSMQQRSLNLKSLYIQLFSNKSLTYYQQMSCIRFPNGISHQIITETKKWS